MHSKGQARRRYNEELKAQVVAACKEPGASVAGVALAYGLNANLVHKWRRGRGVRVAVALPLAAPTPDVAASLPRPVAEFVAMSLPAAVASPQGAPKPADIRIEHKRGATSVVVSWPLSAAGECAAWLRELLR
jgi:transposase